MCLPAPQRIRRNVYVSNNFSGVFANGNMKYEFERDSGPEGSPSLPEMVEAALKVLSKSENGYFLMVS